MEAVLILHSSGRGAFINFRKSSFVSLSRFRSSLFLRAESSLYFQSFSPEASLAYDPSVCPSVGLSVCLLFILRTFSRHFYIIRDVFFDHFTSSISLHCLHCTCHILAQNNQPFYPFLFSGLVILIRPRGNRH